MVYNTSINRIEVHHVLLLIFVEFEVRDGLFKAAGAGKAWVTEDTAGTLRDVSLEFYFFKLRFL